MTEKKKKKRRRGPSPELERAKAEIRAALPPQPTVVEKRPVGAPTAYKPEYCRMLVEHMKGGGAFETFGAEIEVCAQTLYGWAERHEEFLEAKRTGELLAYRWYQAIAQAMLTGTLRRVKEERAVRDSEGNLVYGADGKPIIEKIYEPVRGDAKVLGMWMRARFPHLGFGAKLEITGSGGKPLFGKDVSDMTDDELKAELAELEEQRRQREKLGEK